MYRRAVSLCVRSHGRRCMASSREPPKSERFFFLFSFGALLATPQPPLCADENILEIFSAVNAGTDDKELLFSFLRHMPGTAREVSRFLKGEHPPLLVAFASAPV